MLSNFLNIFEQKSNSRAAAFMLLAAVAWGLFGVISSLASESLVPVILFAGLGNLFAVILGFTTLKILKINPIKTVKFFLSDPNIRKYLLWNAFLGLNLVLSIAGYFLLPNKIIGVAILEASPIFMILASYVLFKKDYKKDTNKTYTWFLILCALSGVLLLLGYNQETQINLTDFSILGILLMLSASIVFGINTVIGNKMTSVIQKVDGTRKNLTTVAETQFVSRLLSMGLYVVICSIAYFFGFIENNDFSLLFTPKVVMLSFLFGFLTGYFQVILIRVATHITTNHNIYSIWFLSPLIGAFLLWYFGYGEINATIILAFALIFVPNILLNLKSK